MQLYGVQRYNVHCKSEKSSSILHSTNNERKLRCKIFPVKLAKIWCGGMSGNFPLVQETKQNTLYKCVHLIIFQQHCKLFSTNRWRREKRKFSIFYMQRSPSPRNRGKVLSFKHNSSLLKLYITHLYFRFTTSWEVRIFGKRECIFVQ